MCFFCNKNVQNRKNQVAEANCKPIKLKKALNQKQISIFLLVTKYCDLNCSCCVAFEIKFLVFIIFCKKRKNRLGSTHQKVV